MVLLAAPRAEGDPSCSWGTHRDTVTTLSLLLEGDPAPHALHLSRLRSAECDTGSSATQGYARRFIRRTLKTMGGLPASHGRGAGMATRTTSRNTLSTSAQEGCEHRSSCLAWETISPA